MDDNGTKRIDRRTLLAAGATGVAAAALGAVAPSVASAADGAPLMIGSLNDGANITILDNASNTAFLARSNFFALEGKTSGNYAGVWGHSDAEAGVGVHGVNEKTKTEGSLAAGATGVRGIAPTDLTHLGLYVDGRVHFKRSGRATIATGKKSVKVAAQGLSASSMVIATLQTNRAGFYVQAAVVRPASSMFTIHVNRAVPAATKVAYFILD